MEITILKLEGNKASFMLKGVTPAIANAIRRTIMAEETTMTIDDVMVVENTSYMYDEILAHRLGLMPLTTDLDSYVLPEECSCGADLGCSRCRTILTLEAEAGSEAKTVYSGELTPQDPEVKPVNPDVPIVKLAPGQKVRIEAYAKLGRGRDHAKWQPVSVCAYKYLPRITVNEELCDGCGECVEYCPKHILTLAEGRLRVVEELKCTTCGECVRHCPKEAPSIEISWDDTIFVFNIESTGVLPIDRIVKDAAKILIKKVEYLSNIVSTGFNLEEDINAEA